MNLICGSCLPNRLLSLLFASPRNFALRKVTTRWLRIYNNPIHQSALRRCHHSYTLAHKNDGSEPSDGITSLVDSRKFYTYRPLPKSGLQTRLIWLLPGHSDDIKCSLLDVSLDDQRVDYVALSYTWNEQKRRRTIVCDDKILHVTENVHDALLQLRQPSTSTLLWVDAVCIDQSSTEERSQQVRYMKQIFHRAHHVISWLGNDEGTAKDAFQLVERICDGTWNVSADAGRDFWASETVRGFWTTESMQKMGLPPFPSREWYALMKLFGLPYFKRIWVVQELVVCKQATIRIGSQAISWDSLEHCARVLLASGWRRAFSDFFRSTRLPTVPVSPAYLKTVANIRLGFSELRGGRGMPLSLLLCATRRFLATDPRDKMLALLGIRKVPSAPGFTALIPDYSKTTEEVYREMTGHTIVREASLTLLSAVEDSSSRVHTSLPSWVPDYSVWKSLWIIGFPASTSKYKASGDVPAFVRWTPGSQFLAVDGFCHDEIATISSEAMDGTTPSNEIVLEWLRIAEPLLRQGRISIDTFWRTLLGNFDRDNYPAAEAFGSHFASFVSETQESSLSKHWSHLLQPGCSNASLFEECSRFIGWQRKLFTTKKGYIGLGPRSARPGDGVCILCGGRVPFLLREDGRYWRFVGEAYVHDLMDGQGLRGGKQRFREFVLL